MIKSITTALLRLPLRQVQMRGSAAVSGDQECVFVRMVNDSGTVGFGEASAWAVFSEQSATAVKSVIDELLSPALVGVEEADRHGVQRAMDAVVPGNAVAKAAVEMATLDLASKSAGVPAAYLLGGSTNFEIALSYSISSFDPDAVRDIARQKDAGGYRIFKLKVGAAEPTTDVRRIRSLRAAVPDAAIRLDFNGRGTEPGLRVLLDPAREAGVEFCEQPFPATQITRLERLRTWFDLPLSLDESVTDAGTLEGLLARGVCEFISIKYGRAGGAQGVIDMSRAAARYGVGVYCGGLNESRLGVAAAMHAFSTVGTLVPGSDFYFPFEVLDDTGVSGATGLPGATGVIGGPVLQSARLSLPRSPGIGARLPDSWFGVEAAA
ncbi:hypothetical protein B1H19_35600 [Streptomyces gilvosporeus]|uniref:Mandelate racemase/muconate lactonizing enzyme C-terminal domain-containing protein n=2 Tax=Streptomyces gilvosporeus TaxID=553510 RepID=A0A1V0U0P8_9ACTN|nr:hypothetical protein B1H19_35600 [Streptomyces gilvosporeus]